MLQSTWGVVQNIRQTEMTMIFETSMVVAAFPVDHVSIAIDVPRVVKLLSTTVTKARVAACRNHYDMAIDLYEYALFICEETDHFDVLLTCQILKELSQLYRVVGNVEQSEFLCETARKVLAAA